MKKRAAVVTGRRLRSSRSPWPRCRLQHTVWWDDTDLPVPSWLFGWAAAIVLVVSFLALALLWPEPRLQRPVTRPLFRMPRAVDVLCAVVGIGLFVLVIYSGFAGSQETQSNFAPTFVYVHFWIGLTIACVLLGDVFRAFNPWLAIGRAGSWLGAPGLSTASLQATRLSGVARPLAAVAGILGFAWLELAYVNKGDPSTLAILSLAYAAIQLAGMALFGVEALEPGWGRFRRLLQPPCASLAIRAPGRGPASAPPPFGGTGAAARCRQRGAALCRDRIDDVRRLLERAGWSSISPDIQSFFSDLGAGERTAIERASTVGTRRLRSCSRALLTAWA